MARRLKDRPLTEGEKAFQWFSTLGAQHKYFQTPFLANGTIVALLGRIARRSPKEARWLKREIKLLVAAEWNINPSPEEAEEFRKNPTQVLSTGLAALPSRVILDKICKARLLSIVSDKVPREDHDRFTIADQRKWLTRYLYEQPIKPSASPRQYKTWLIKHWQALYKGLKDFDCLCEYRSSLDGIAESDLRDCRGPAILIEILLAELHRSTPSAMRKVLSHSTRK